jgi:hypothetical protein
MLDLSQIAAPSPDFSQALGIRYPNPPSGPTPTRIRLGVARLRQIRDRREKLRFGLRVLHEMLYLAECPDDFLAISNLLVEVGAELSQLDP